MKLKKKRVTESIMPDGGNSRPGSSLMSSYGFYFGDCAANTTTRVATKFMSGDIGNKTITTAGVINFPSAPS